MAYIKVFVFFIVLISVFLLLFKGKGNHVIVYDPAIPKEHVRTIDQTFLTYPEWFLVFSPDEYAQFVKKNYSQDFPYFTHIKQVWTSYYDIGQRIKPYPFNTGYHVMILVISTSTTLEYSLKSIYENVFGRISSLWGRTWEDDYLAQVAQEYVDFIKISPWYDFDFYGKIPSLMKLPNQNFRSIERKYMLLTEYVVKGTYGKVLGFFTHLTYEKPILQTAIHIKTQHNPFSDSSLNSAEILSTLPDGTMVLLVPRYDAFKDYLNYLVQKNIPIISIAGNTENILISFIIPHQNLESVKNELNTLNLSTLFIQSIVTQDKDRMVVEVPINQLDTKLTKINEIGQVEHVFDF